MQDKTEGADRSYTFNAHYSKHAVFTLQKPNIKFQPTSITCCGVSSCSTAALGLPMVAKKANSTARVEIKMVSPDFAQQFHLLGNDHL